MSSNVYIDVEAPHLREHMMETLGVLCQLDSDMDMTHFLIEKAIDRYDLAEHFATAKELFGGDSDTDPEGVSAAQAAVLNMLRYALMPMLAKLRRDKTHWLDDFFERAVEEHPILEDVDPIVPSKVLTPTGRHILRIYVDADDAEKESRRIMAAFEQDEARA